ncbi:MAG: pentapeptide repeat-containing protein, partial [Nitrospira sp.]|nr:pentapeptide repeat-containing protein [Nitrospira sp.]
ADLRGTNLEGASLRHARLQGVALRYTHGLTQEQLNAACLDVRTRLPEGLQLPPPCENEKSGER